MKHNTPLHFFPLLFTLVFFVGCGDPKVTGKVTYSDGTPITVGQVMFQRDNFVASGDIKPDGSYSAGKNKDGDGLPPGVYKVYISGATKFGEIKKPAKEAAIGQIPVFQVAPTIQMVHTKYTMPESSGLSVDVKGNTKYDITVEPPQ